MGRKTNLIMAILAVLLICALLPQPVLAVEHGDFTEDGKIGSQDALYLLRHVLNPQGYPVEQSADINGDGKVNTKDALHLLRHSLSPNSYPVTENHEPVALPGKAATCTEDGLTVGSACAVCQKTLEAQTVIPALDHLYVDGVCSRCGAGSATQDLQFQRLPDGSGYKLTGIGQDSRGDIVVPETYNGLPVTVIGSRAFCGDGIVSVTLGKQIQRVESCAFYQCPDLTQITILSEDVTFDGSSIVHQCPALETVLFAGDPVHWSREGFYLDEHVRLVLNYGHNYAAQILSPADCTHSGITRYTCRDCGRTFDQPTEALGHFYAAADRVEPTCTEPGSVDGNCTRCGLHSKQSLSPKGHSIDSYTLQDAPSCEAPGSEIGYCTECEQWLQRTIPALAHTPGAFVPSGEHCGDRALGSAACTVCGQIAYSVEHLLHTQTQLPTCTQAGSTITACTNCSYTVSTPLDATGHTPGQWEIQENATCAAEGTKVKKCTGCSAVVATGSISKCDHQLLCTVADGTCTYTCQNCDHTESVSIEHKHKLTLVSNTQDAPLTLYIENGQIPQLPTPVWEENIFLGWYTDPNCAVAYENAPITADLTLYALWVSKNITVSDNGPQGVVQTADTQYQFVVKSPIVLNATNLSSYITVTSSKKEQVEIFVVGSDGDTYRIGGNYVAGDIYEAIAAGGITFVDSGESSLWFVVTGPTRENVEVDDSTVTVNASQILGGYSDGQYTHLFTAQDLMNVGQLVVITGDSDQDLIAFYEIVEETTEGAMHCYQCVAPDPADAISKISLFKQVSIDFSNVELPEDWENAVTMSVLHSEAYAAFRNAAAAYAAERSSADSKYTYTLTDFKITPTRKTAWSSDTGRNELILGAEISCKLERRNKNGGVVVDISTMTLTLENRFSADADVSADGILGGDARVVLTTHNVVSVDLTLKLGLMDDDDDQEARIREFYKNYLDKKELLPIDTIPDGQETLIPAFYLPIPLGAGFALDINAYLVLDWEVCGEFGASVQYKNTMSFGFELNDWEVRTVAYCCNDLTTNVYLAGKMRAAAGIRPEVGLSWAKIVRAGANITLSVYAESGGMVGFVAGSHQDFTPLRAGYIACGANIKAQVVGEIGFRRLKYEFDYTFFDRDYPLFSLGTKKMPLNFEQSGEEYVIYMDYDKALNLLDRVDTIIRFQSLDTMEINRELAEKCYFTLEAPVSKVSLTPDGALKIAGCDQTAFDITVRITSGTVYKLVTVHIQIDHTHDYTTTDYLGNCVQDTRKLHACNSCTYRYWEVVTVAPGHDYSLFVVDRYPTCTQAGQRHGTCARCDYTATETMPALGHDYSLQIIAPEHLLRHATCQNPARYYYVCANCGGHSLNHTYDHGELADHSYADPYTCHDRPCTTHGCSHVSYASTPHPFTPWITVEAGGCCEESYAIRACRDCGYTETTLGSNVIKQHEWQLLPDKAPTCQEPGYQNYIVCVVCEKVANKTAIPTLEHILLYKDITDTTHVAYCHRDGCDYESQPVTHTHTDWTVVYPAECEKEGLEHGFCVCGHVKTQAIDATGHTHTGVITTPPSCTVPGVKTYTCPCGDSYTEPIAATGHSPSGAVMENIVNATCTQAGSYDSVVYCATCHTQLSRQTIPVAQKGHVGGSSVIENETDSTCTQAGSYEAVIYCISCSQELSRKTQHKDLADHTPGAVQRENETESTCQQAGTYDEVTYCTVCGAETSRQSRQKDLIDCTPGSIRIEKETDSTCQTAGQYDEVTYCIHCGNECSRNTVKKDLLPHIPGSIRIENETDSTCQKAGQHDEVVCCTACGEELSRKTVLKPLADCKEGPVQTENETDSTCQKAGQYDEVTYCTVCGKELSRKTVLKPLADCQAGPVQTENETDSTCQAAGQYDQVTYCTVCGKELSRETLMKPLADCKEGPMLIENSVLPTCTEDGHHDEVICCTVCGRELRRETVTDKALSHDIANGTTAFDGDCHWTVCGREGCGEILNKASHTGSWVTVQPSTCSEKGSQAYRCACGYQATRELELTDHDHSGAWLSDGEQHYRLCPDCRQQIDIADHDHSGTLQQNAQQHYRICPICQANIDFAYHIPVQNGEIKPATCTEDGYTPFRCQECHYTWNGDRVQAPGHSWSTQWAYDETCHYYPCLNCDAREPGSVLAHTLQTQITQAATCTTPGSMHISCAVCDYATSQVIDPLTHDIANSAQQYDSDYHWVQCARDGCGEILNKTVHTHTPGTPVKPDCENPGYTLYTCACGHSYEADPKDALGHSAMDVWHVDETTGEHYHACDRAGCGYETHRGAHSFGDWVSVTDPTCASYGISQRQCTVCQHTETDSQVAMLPHDLYEDVSTTSKPVTGGVEYHHCVVQLCRNCDYSRQIGETVVSSHAQIIPLSKVWPTCTESGLETGWNCAFPGCTDASHSLPQVEIPALGHAFVDGYCTRCGVKNNDLHYTLNEDGESYRVTGIGNCTDTDIRIPAIYKGLPVTMIGTSAFAGNTTITSVHIPDTVDTIMWYAFYQCSNLTQVHIPNSVTGLGGYAFFGCTNLTAIDLPDNLTAIQDYTFQGCSRLTSVTIPGNVTQIGKSAFERCRGLTRIDIPLSVTSIGDKALYNCTALEYIYYAGTTVQWAAITKGSLWDSSCTYTLVCLGDPTGSQGLAYTPSSDGTYYIVSGIGDCADTQIVIPETYLGLPVKEIGADAFSNRTGITSISIPEGVTTIGDWAFNQCTGLTEITIPQSATTLGNYLFYGCTSLKEVALPSGVTAVNTYMFYNCTGLERVEIPESVTTIGSFAFYNCTSLKWTEIPATVKTIGSQAFCNSGLTSLVIPDSVTVVGTQAFSGCTGLMEVTLSQNLTQIGTQVFYNCTSLQKITIPGKVTSIATRAFAGCTGLTEITIPVSVTSISGRALQECTGMQTIYFEGTSAQWEAITKASYWNQNCPGELVCLGDYNPAFSFERSTDGTYYIVYGTNELTDAHVVIPSMYWGKPVKEIGDFAFGYNTMTSVTIPATIERINDEAFTDCYDLTAVYITDLAAWCRIEFGEVNAHPLAYARNLYLNGSLVQNLQIPGTVSAISDRAFQFCDSLVTVTIENGVTSIGYGAFYGCHNLTRVDIPASVTSIGAYAFHVDDGTKLAGIWVDAQNPNYSSDAYGVLFNKGKTILIRAPHALSGTYVIPSTVQTIEEDAFSYCDSLTALVMDKNVTVIGDWAINCWDLEDTYYCGSVDDWNAMDIGTANNDLFQTIRYYSETRPAEYASDYWHYVNGVPTIWS